MLCLGVTALWLWVSASAADLSIVTVVLLTSTLGCTPSHCTGTSSAVAQSVVCFMTLSIVRDFFPALCRRLCAQWTVTGRQCLCCGWHVRVQLTSPTLLVIQDEHLCEVHQGVGDPDYGCNPELGWALLAGQPYGGWSRCCSWQQGQRQGEDFDNLR